MNWDLILEFFIEILIATGVLGAFFKIFKYAVKKITDKRLSLKVHKVLVKKFTLYDLLQTTLHYVKGHRIVLLRLENGGNVPELTSVLKCTVIEESYDAPLSSNKHRWQKREVDMAYIKVIIKMGKKSVFIETKALEENSILKNLYERQNIVCSKLYYISTTSKYLYYISINFIEHKKINPAEEEEINSLINSIRILL